MDMFAVIGLVIIILYIIYSIYTGRQARAIENAEIAKRNREKQDRIHQKRHREQTKNFLLNSFKRWHNELQEKDKGEVIESFDKELRSSEKNRLLEFFCSEAIKHVASDSPDEFIAKLESQLYRQRTNTFDWIIQRMKLRYDNEILREQAASGKIGIAWVYREKTSKEEYREDILEVISTFEIWKKDVKKETERKQQEEKKRARERRLAELKEESRRIELKKINREREERQKRARRVFSKDDPEWNSNGDYTIEGEDYMSIWKYKINNEISPNSNSTNGSDSRRLVSRGVSTYMSIPDHGVFGKVQLFRVEDLDDFYS